MALQVVRAYDAVVLAADRPRAQELLPELGPWEGTSSSTWYFAMQEPPVREPLIVLNSSLQARARAVLDLPRTHLNTYFR